MIVHTMTHAEMVLDARKDIQAMRNKCTEPLRKLRRELFASKHDTLLHLFDWKSPNKNNWLVLIRHSKKRSLTLSLAWFPDKEEKLAALWVTGAGIAYYIDSHVFERFGERFDPDQIPLDRLVSFFLENHVFSVEPTAQKGEQLFEVNIGANQGLGLGEWDRSTDIVHWRTFVNHGQLFSNQEVAMERMDWDRVLLDMTPGQRQHLISVADKRDPQLAAFLRTRFAKAA